MKNRLPDLTKGSKLNIETEVLSNGKIRVSLEVQDKAVTFDWKINQEVELTQLTGMGLMMSGAGKALYFGMRFSHEDWRIGVEWSDIISNIAYNAVNSFCFYDMIYFLVKDIICSSSRAKVYDSPPLFSTLGHVSQILRECNQR